MGHCCAFCAAAAGALGLAGQACASADATAEGFAKHETGCAAASETKYRSASVPPFNGPREPSRNTTDSEPRTEGLDGDTVLLEIFEPSALLKSEMAAEKDDSED